MVYSFKIDTELGYLQEQFEGDLNAQGLRASLERLSMDSRFHPDLMNLVDMRQCRLTLSLAEIPSLVQSFSETFKGGKGRTAYLVRDSKSTATLMLFSKQTLQRQSAIFSTEEKALEWLGVGSLKA